MMLEERPEDTLNCLSLAAAEVRDVANCSFLSAWTKRRGITSNLCFDKILRVINVSPDPEPETTPILHRVRLCNYGNEIRLKDFRSHSVGHLVTFKGTIVRVSPVTPLVKALHFVCELCSFKWKVFYSDGSYRKPSSCPVNYCRSKVISPSGCVNDTETVDYQQIRCVT